MPIQTWGVFHLQKISENFYWEFPFGKSPFHAFAQVPFRGDRGTPGRLNDRERYGTGDKNNKDEKSVNGTQIFHWEVPFIPENFPWNEPKSRVPFTSQPEFPEFFGKWKTTLVDGYLAI